MKLKYAVIEWLDHCSYGSQVWRPMEDSIRKNLYKCVTAGFILDENKDLITLGLTLGGVNTSNSASFSGDMTIAKKLITKKKVFNWEVKGG